MPGPRATAEYVAEASAAGMEARQHLTAASQACLEAAQAQSRQLNDNHVGTEHVVLGILAIDSPLAACMASVGITESVFRAQLFEEPGPSPEGTIPLTPRAEMILGLAHGIAASQGHAISPRHLMLGVIAESRDWRERGFDGPHHLDQAAQTVGTDLTSLQEVVLRY